MMQGGGGGYGPPPGPGGYGAPPPGGGGYGGPPPGGPPGPGGYGPPPGGPPPGGSPYGAPPGGPMMGGGGGPLTPQASQVLKERSGVTVLLLTFVTCGIYGLIWKYQTTDELRIASGDESIKPGLDLVLAFVTCGIWAIYTDYRNAKKLNDMLRALGSSRSDQSTIIILLWVFGLGFASIFLLQEEFNALAKAARGERV